jgi:Flp pilus assembly protein TadG
MAMRERHLNSERGYVLIYMVVILGGLMLFSGLALDAGRSYVVKAQLGKAVDGAALAAARAANSGDPRAEAVRVFRANFPVGTLGTQASPDPTAAADFFSAGVDQTGRNIVDIKASVVLPTTFMRLANLDDVTIRSEAQATRRLVDLSLVLDVSSSIGTRWPAVRDAARMFIESFDERNDRLSLVTFSNGARVLDRMPSGRGFDKDGLVSDVPQSLPGGSTLMVEGLYRGWDELRAVAPGQQSGLRIIVLFTDGASNGVPGNYDGSGPRSLRTWDFPKAANDPDNQTWDSPRIDGLYHTETGATSPSYTLTVPWNSTQTLSQIRLLPAQTWHPHGRAGTPTSFPLVSSSLTVNGIAQSAARPLRHRDGATGRYPAEVWNINNAARNVLEIIANEARNDAGDYRIRIYTIGMGYLLRNRLGTMPEMPEDILKRVANDKTSPDFNSAQLEGKYFYARTAGDVAAAFQGIQNEILRLSR